MPCGNSAFTLLLSQDGGGKYKGKHQVLTSTATVTINVIDSQDMPPYFVGTPYFGYVYEVSVPVSSCRIHLSKFDYGYCFCLHYVDVLFYF